MLFIKGIYLLLFIFRVLYNEAVKALNTYHYVATAQRLLGKLESYSLTLVRLQQQAVQLTNALESKQE